MLQIIGLFFLIGLVAIALKNIGKILSFLIGISIIGGCIWLVYQYPIQTITSLALLITITAIISKISDAALKRKIESLIEDGDKKNTIKYYSSQGSPTKRNIIIYIQNNTSLRTKGELLPSLFSSDFIDYMSKRSNSSTTSIVERAEVENHLNSIWNLSGLEKYTVSNADALLKKAKHAYSVTFETPNGTEKGKPIELIKLSTEPDNDPFENAIDLDEE